jgi:hypothetical protein
LYRVWFGLNWKHSFPENFDYVVDKIRRKNGYNNADGGFDFSIDFDNQDKHDGVAFRSSILRAVYSKEKRYIHNKNI